MTIDEDAIKATLKVAYNVQKVFFLTIIGLSQNLYWSTEKNPFE